MANMDIMGVYAENTGDISEYMGAIYIYRRRIVSFTR
jgi:hypothetical protein